MASTAPRHRHKDGEEISRYSGKQYRSESFQIRSADKHKAWRDNDPEYQAVLDGIPTAKTVSVETIKVGCP